MIFVLFNQGKKYFNIKPTLIDVFEIRNINKKIIIINKLITFILVCAEYSKKKKK